MTTAPPDQLQPAPAGGSGSTGASGATAAAPKSAAPRTRPPRTIGSILVWTLFWLALLAVIAAIPTLGWMGAQAILDSSEGKLYKPITDPAAPGYVVNVYPTPTALVVGRGADGSLTGLTLLVQPDEQQGGAVLFIPVDTVVELPALGWSKLRDVYAIGGTELVRKATERLLRTSAQEVIEVDPARWSELTEPVAPIALDNPTAVLFNTPGRETPVRLFDAGSIEVRPVQVSLYLDVTSSGSSDLNRVERHEVFWRAWIEAVAKSGRDDAVPGESDRGIGKYVRGLSGGDVRFLQLPVEPALPREPEKFDGREYWEIPRSVVEALMADIVPYPVGSSPGDRARVKVLDGVGREGLSVQVARMVVPAGAEIIQVGNSEEFGLARTRVIYNVPRERVRAERIAKLIGAEDVGLVRTSSDTIDITVIVGQDFIEKLDRGEVPAPLPPPEEDDRVTTTTTEAETTTVTTGDTNG